MDKLTTTLLTSAAVAGLAVSPAMAAVHSTGHHGPLLAVKTSKGVITMGGIQHLKTSADKGMHHDTTFTATFYQYSGTFNVSTAYKQTIDLPAFAFYTISAGGHCVDYQPQKAKAAAIGGNGKAKVYTSKGHVTLTSCTGTLTYFGPAYKLTNKNATSTQVQLNDKIEYTTTTTTTTTGKKQKKHKHKHKNYETGREIVNLKFK